MTRPGAGEGGGQAQRTDRPALPAADAAGFDALRDGPVPDAEVSFDAKAGVTFMSDKGVELKILGTVCISLPP